MIDEFLEYDVNVRLAIYAETGKGTTLAETAVATDVEAVLIYTTAIARQARESVYSQAPTHECYLKENADFVTGRTVQVTAYREDDGTWTTDSDGARYLILGAQRQYGVAAPRDHIRYDLLRRTKGV